METARICAADGCEHPFNPRIPEQKYCSSRCASRSRVRHLRAKRRKTGGGDDGGGGGLHATLGGAVDYAASGVVSDKNRYSVQLTGPKPPSSVRPKQTPRSPQHAHAA